MSKKDKSANPRQQSGSNSPSASEQPIAGRLHGSGTEMERTYDGLHDISNVDRQEGNMNHGTKGGCFDEEQEEDLGPTH
jgi:hypothetical protein